MARLSAVDAQAYWMSAKIPSDQFLLYGFAGTTPDVGAVVQGLRARAAECPELRIRVAERNRWSYPQWVPTQVSAEQFVVHDAAMRWSDCLAAVMRLDGIQLDPQVTPWRLHVFPDVSGMPGADRATVAVMQVPHALADGVRASALAAWLFGRAQAVPPVAAPRPLQALAMPLRGVRAARAHRRLVQDTEAGLVPPPAVKCPALQCNSRPEGGRLLRTVALESYEQGKELRLKKVPDYNGEGDPRKAYADEIVFDTTVASADAASQQLQTGTADIGLYIRAYPANVIAQYKKTDPDHLHSSASGSAVFISWNNPDKPATPGQEALKDLRVRQAFNYALDKADVVRGLGGPDAAQVSDQILTSTIVGYNEDSPYSTPDGKGYPEKAKALLAEAGRENLTVNLAYRTNPEFEKIATSVQNSAKRAGIDVKLTPVPADSWSALNAFLGDKSKVDQWDLAITTWTPDWQGNSARMTLGGWLNSDFAPGGTWNGVTYSNPKLNEAAARAFAAPDPTGDWQEANRIATEDLAWFPLIERVKTVPTSDRVTNWTWQSLGNGADITNIAVTG